ncbi:MAG: hypothetical protein HY318_11000, partial [Armatimonadetes bacterium]|nr:hypothetical protein [Armatimonadota bacterium]
MKLAVKSLAVSLVLCMCWVSAMFASPGEKQAGSTGAPKPATGKLPSSGSGKVKSANARTKPAKKLPPTATAAVVNGQKITVGEVDKALDQV